MKRLSKVINHLLALVKGDFEIFNTGDSTDIEKIFAAEHVLHDTHKLGSGNGIAGVKQRLEIFRSAFPDTHFIILSMELIDSDQVQTVWRVQATHTGLFLGIAATFKQVVYGGRTVSRIENGKIIESWQEWDFDNLIRQLTS